MSDYRDVVIADFAASEAALLERVVDLTIERDSYRLVAAQSIHALHHQGRELALLHARHERLIEEYRRFRVATMAEDVAA